MTSMMSDAVSHAGWPELRCINCREYVNPTTDWRCECGGIIEIVGSQSETRASAQGAAVAPGIWRHGARIRVPPDVMRLSLGEADTPLIPLEHPEVCTAGRLSCKLDSLSPTGSFKDRGTAVMLAVACQLGFKRVVADSSGNAGSSVSAYAAAYGLACDIYVSSETSPAKIQQIAAYGARVILIDGNRTAVSLAAQSAIGDAFYASHYWNPFFLEGTKTTAYELWEQCGKRAPDHVFVPVGHGTLYLGLLRGFENLLAEQAIRKLPRLHAVQAAGCAPIHAARTGAQPTAVPDGSSAVTEGIRVANPIRLPEILDGLDRTHGSVLIARDSETLSAQQALAHRGVFVEPTSAVSLAGYWHHVQADLIVEDELAVIIATGHGLKTAVNNGRAKRAASAGAHQFQFGQSNNG